MELAFSLAGAGAGLAIGTVAAGRQHHLYRNPEHRAQRASGARLVVMRLAVGAACAVVVGLATRPGHYDAGAAALTAAFGVVLVILASTDFERRMIPNRLTYPALVVAAALCWAWPDRSVGDIAWGTAFAVGISAGLFALGLLLGGAMGVRGGALGLGDVKLMVLLGLLLGWPLIMTAILAGVVLAGVPALALTLIGRGRGFFSYGPYLAAGGLIAMLWPERFL